MIGVCAEKFVGGFLAGNDFGVFELQAFELGRLVFEFGNGKFSGDGIRG